MKDDITQDSWLLKELQDAEFAAEFLNAASEDDDPKTYLTALRKVVEARGGMASVAERTQLSRETLYRTLSSEEIQPSKHFTQSLKLLDCALLYQHIKVFTIFLTSNNYTWIQGLAPSSQACVDWF